jgi:AcrR family transcriptional regulator
MKSDYFKEAFQKIPDEKQRKILDAAIMEFAGNGFDSANINSIAQNSGISVGSVYKYFDNKEDLYLTVIHTGVETLKGVLEEIMESGDGFEKRIEKILRAIQSYSRDNVHLTRLYNEMTTENRSGLVWKIVSDMENATAGLYKSLIEKAQERGEIRADADPGLFAFYLDNLFILLQFSYACDYYKERMKIFVGEDVFEQDEKVVEQLMKFIKGAFFIK